MSRKILAVASGGGHWVQLLRLRPALIGCRVTYVTVQSSYADQVPGERFHAVSDATRWDRVRLVQMALQMIWILVKERPDVVISTGAAPGVVALRLGKWMGARTVWVDSIANVEALSMSGRRVKTFADLTLSQWPDVAAREGCEFRGAVL